MDDGGLPTLSNGEIVLRRAESWELDELATRLSADPEASPWLGTDPGATARWFHDEGVSAFAITVGGCSAGVVTFEEELDPDYRNASIDIGLLAPWTGQGHGTAALRALIRWLIDERGHHRFTIDPAVGNARAIRAYEKVGFRAVGVLREAERGSDGAWHDNLLMDLLAREFDDSEPM